MLTMMLISNRDIDVLQKPQVISLWYVVNHQWRMAVAYSALTVEVSRLSDLLQSYRHSVVIVIHDSSGTDRKQ